MGPLEKKITEKLQQAFQPVKLRVVNESHRHAGHAGHDGTGETHFLVEMTATAFAGQSRVAAQRLVYAALGEEFDNGLHALSLSLSAP